MDWSRYSIPPMQRETRFGDRLAVALRQVHRQHPARDDVERAVGVARADHDLAGAERARVGVGQQLLPVPLAPVREERKLVRRLVNVDGRIVEKR